MRQSHGSMFPKCSLDVLGSCFNIHETLVSLAPSAGIEPATYGLGSLYRFLEAFASDNKATHLKRIRLHSFVGDMRRRESHVHFSVHRVSDIHPLKIQLAPISVGMVIIGCNGLVIYTALVPYFFGNFSISCTAAVPEWSIILSDTWTYIPASLSVLPLQSSARWTFWRASVMQPVARSFVKRLSSTLQHDSNPLKPKMPLDIGEYLLGGFLNPCW